MTARPTATAHAALVLLAFGDATGYQLKQRADRTLHFFFNAPAMSQIYTELDRLAAGGLVSAQAAPRGTRHTLRYALTDAGREALRRWLADDELAATVFKSHLALRLVVGYLVGPDRLRADIDTERSRVHADLAAVEAVRASLPPDDPRLGWAWLVASWGARYYGDMLGQLDELRDNLDELAARIDERVQ